MQTTPKKGAAPKKETKEERIARLGTPRERFVKNGNRRANSIIKGTVSLGKLSATGANGYEYTPEDVATLFTAIREAVDAAEARFSQVKVSAEPVVLIK